MTQDPSSSYEGTGNRRTLFIGRQLVEGVVDAGHEVAVLHRKPKHDFGAAGATIRWRTATTPRRSAKPLDGRRFDVVYDNVYDWERGTTAAQVEATVRACGDRLSAIFSCPAWRPTATA